MLGFWAVRKVAIEELIYDILLANKTKMQKKMYLLFVWPININQRILFLAETWYITMLQSERHFRRDRKTWNQTGQRFSFPAGCIMSRRWIISTKSRSDMFRQSWHTKSILQNLQEKCYNGWYWTWKTDGIRQCLRWIFLDVDPHVSKYLSLCSPASVTAAVVRRNLSCRASCGTLTVRSGLGWLLIEIPSIT